MSQAGIINVSSSGGSGILSIKGDDGTTVLPDGAGNIQLDGLVVPNGTHSKAVFTESPAVHIENIDVQVSAAIASSDVTKVGLAAFDNTEFTVDANGFVQNVSPSQIISDFDDMISASGSTSSNIGKFSWSDTGGSGVSLVNGTATHPGILQLSVAGVAIGGVAPLLSGNSSASFVLGGGSLSMNFVFDIAALSDGINTYTIYLGLIDGGSLNTSVVPISGCFFKYTNSVNAGNWQIVTEQASVATTANTATAAATGFHNYGIQVNAAATSVAFTINGVAVANSPLTTNIPTAQLMPAIVLDVSAGVSPLMLFDLFYYKQVLTVAR